jgi:hypothetical protein
MKFFSSKIKNKKLVQKLVLEQKKNKKHEKKNDLYALIFHIFLEKDKKR